MAFTDNEIKQIIDAFLNATSERQYIGARYVPIFGRKGESSISWDNTKPYEPLTIVLHEGNSYTSRQYVPVGVEITNTAFWANTGNYNAQVESYRAEVAALEEYVDDEIEDLTAHVDKKDIIVIGDSYSKYSYANDAVVSSGEELWTKVKNLCGLDNVYNYAVGGAGFVNTEYTNQTFINQFNSAVGANHDISRLRCIIVFGGTNDYGLTNATSLLQDAITAFQSTYNNSIYKNVPLIFVFNKAGYGANRSTMISAIMLKAKITSAIANATYVDATGYLCGYDQLGNDRVHPNTAGYNNLTKLMCAVLNNLPIPTYLQVTATNVIENSNITLQVYKAWIEENVLHCEGRLRVGNNVDYGTTLIPILKLNKCAPAFQDTPSVLFGYSSAVMPGRVTLAGGKFAFYSDTDGEDGVIGLSVADFDATSLAGPVIVNFEFTHRL